MQFDTVSTEPLTGYAPETAVGLYTTKAQMYVSGKNLMWEPVGGGANFPVNTNITSMTGIVAPNGGTGISITGAGTGAAIFVTNGVQTSGWGVNGIIDVEGVNCAGNIIAGSLQTSGSNPALATNGIVAQVANGPLQLQGQGNSLAGVQLNSTNTVSQQLWSLANYFTRTTVGAAGGASAPPATPTLWVPIVVNGTEYAFAAYAKS